MYGNIIELTLSNNNYRKVIETSDNLQLVLMSLLPKQDIGSEVHSDVTQFFHIVEGHCIAVVDGVITLLEAGDYLVVKMGSTHNIINPSKTKKLKLYTIYTPPEHSPKTLQRLKPKSH